MKISEITGTITLADGSTSAFRVFTDGGWQQWDANAERLGQTTDALEAMSNALMADELLASSDDEDA